MTRLTTGSRKWWILATMTGALSMVLIDETLVSVALPTIQRELHLSPSGLQWVVNAYLLALASCVAVGGRLGELAGQPRMFRLGAVVFVAASAGCGLAPSGALLIAGRAAQGLGAAMMIPASGAIVINAFSVAERGRAMGSNAGISMIWLALGAGMRVIVLRERPHPGAQLRFTDIDGHRFTCFATEESAHCTPSHLLYIRGGWNEAL